MGFLYSLDIGYEVYLATLELFAMVCSREGDLESYLISYLGSNEFLLESRDKRC